MNKILIIDDEKGIREILASILEDEGYFVETAESGEIGLDKLKNDEFSLIFLDLWLPGIDGLQILEKISKELTPPEVIIISGHANVDVAVKAIKNGAFDCIEKPLDLNRILSLSKSAINKYKKRTENFILRDSSIKKSDLIGECPEIKKIKELIKQVGFTDSRVLILGENGTGKEVIAREIFKNSLRKDKPFIEVNCAAIPDNLIESELFGHEKGAFTGAHEGRIGKFEAAHGGTLFLDEIADMSLMAQAKVLRAIQEQKFHKVGSEKLIDVDIRIISATNKNIQEEIKNGNFREDLFFRLNVIPIELPSLRQRGDDVIILSDYFLQSYNKENKTNKKIVKDSITVLKEHTWPGNVRELKNFIEKACIISPTDNIDLKEFFNFSINHENNSSNLDDYTDLPLNQAKDEFEKKIIYNKLCEFDGNITKAANALGIYPSNLHNKIKKYGIKIDK
ncbi:MAG: sigma-54-dependent Fis family transcriptional regulator [Spirochaetales bacterium]|nr:sigma-54-dependent Fis family transcriptional regulator [Spirochaetales bacterium]